MNPGELRHRVSILSLNLNLKVYSWVETSKIYCKKELQNKKSIFSKFGFGENNTIKFTTRFNKNLSLNNALIHEGKHYLISSIIDKDGKRAFYEINAVQITPKSCEVKRLVEGKDAVYNRSVKKLETLYTFPGYMVEKYIKYDQEKVNSTTSSAYILITPKAINLEVGDLVIIDGITYNVQIPHTLDEYKNEYEIAVKKDE